VPSAGVVSMPRRKKVEEVQRARRYVIAGRKIPGRGGIKRTARSVCEESEKDWKSSLNVISDQECKIPVEIIPEIESVVDCNVRSLDFWEQSHLCR